MEIQFVEENPRMKKNAILKRVAPKKLKEIIKSLLGLDLLHARLSEGLKRAEEAVRIAGADIDFLLERVDQLEQRLLMNKAEPFRSELASGCIDKIAYDGHILDISGWMLLPQREFDSLSVLINNEKACDAIVTKRKDIPRYWPYTHHATRSGFRCTINKPADEMNGMVDIAVAGLINGREIARIETWFHQDLYKDVSTPPAHLMQRVSGHQNPSLFLVTGLQSFKDFWQTAGRYRDKNSVRRVLDWGCGCGRITGFFLRFSGIPEVYGCDIDEEAVVWCRNNLKPGKFSAIPLDPPTRYSDATFDLIIGNSVFTHLPKEKQFLWLQEMRRILAPGGLFLATVHGDFAARWVLGHEKKRDMLRDGILDDLHDKACDGISPKGYYRGVFQTRNYTMREWATFFEILEYKERGAFYFQDMVVMQKREGA